MSSKRVRDAAAILAAHVRGELGESLSEVRLAASHLLGISRLPAAAQVAARELAEAAERVESALDGLEETTAGVLNAHILVDRPDAAGPLTHLPGSLRT